MRRVVIMGAAGRDFHDFNTVFRDDPDHRVVAFTATQIPGIDGRVYPPVLAGPAYPEGIPIRPQDELEQLVHDLDVDEVVLSYSDLPHAEVMHQASRVLATGADFRLLGPDATMLDSPRPVVAVTAVRTGCGKSQTTRAIGRLLLDQGLRVALVRHPMPYGDLAAMRVQRFATLEDIDASHPTIEEREEYETPVTMGMVMYAGVDYADILARAAEEADVVIWDGGNNDLPFYRPDVHIVVVDPLRPGHEVAYHPGEANLRMADVVVVNKVDSADPLDVAAGAGVGRRGQPGRRRGRGGLAGHPRPGAVPGRARVVVVEDGPTITHGGMPWGAGTVAAREAGAEIVDPRPHAVGSLADTYARYPDIGPVLPAMGYGDAQVHDLEATIRATDCDAVISGTPADLARLVEVPVPLRRATYELEEIGSVRLADVLAPHARKWG